MNLNDTWTNCLKMWKWISEQDGNAIDLKEQWRTEHGFGRIIGNCFFCDHAGLDRDAMLDCTKCPGVLIDKHFHCSRADYFYLKKPKAFYKKIVELNKKRLK